MIVDDITIHHNGMCKCFKENLLCSFLLHKKGTVSCTNS